ncbi:putative mitochondrial glycoprotein [Septoria linicola]|nr:putative mitochondrial glycoprotein [Septoria linicola]
MMSLRTLARSAPRTAARFATTSIKPSPFPSTIRSRISPHTPRSALFSTTRTRFDEHSQQLAAKLESEISIEHDESASQAGSDQNIEQFKAENPFWSIEDVAGEQDVFLTRKYEDEQITVHFSIADFNSEIGEEGYGEEDMAMADEDMDVQSGGANTKGAINKGGKPDGNFKVAPEESIAPADREELTDDESGPQQFPVAVTVLVQRPAKGALKFYLTASDGDFMINQLVQLPKDVKGDAKALIRDHAEHLYAGPPFQQLDEEVQGILESYLNARGVSEYLAQVVPDYIDVKEQKEYLGWLNRVKEFVE